jgi:transketolase
LRLDKSIGDDRPRESGEVFRVGRARTLRDGSDCAILVTGGILEEVWYTAELLEKYGIRAKIVSMHTIKPLDIETILEICRNVKTIITVEEHTIYGGLGGAVAETLMDHEVYPAAFLRIGLKDGFSSIVGTQKYLRQQYGIDAHSICTRILSHLQDRYDYL